MGTVQAPPKRAWRAQVRTGPATPARTCWHGPPSTGPAGTGAGATARGPLDPAGINGHPTETNGAR
ncbi:hypothetical protein GCM10010308_41310 [Streptomyces vinaceusdrappus]|nr:hypothetical protein GCM10010308_41310 [Streptomyces vinaceusdrappus]